jgi:hypothetical protein
MEYGVVCVSIFALLLVISAIGPYKEDPYRYK